MEKLTKRRLAGRLAELAMLTLIPFTSVERQLLPRPKPFS
jgi:hypothetical protein